MQVQKGLPLAFSGQESFIAKYGNSVWIEVCEMCDTGNYYNVRYIASRLPTLQGYKNPGKYLRVVLANVILERQAEGLDTPVEFFANRRIFMLL